MKEIDIQNAVRIELSRLGCVTHRTNSGLFYSIEPKWFKSNLTVSIGEFLHKIARPIRIGTPGMTDLQGHRPDGKCFYLEIKRPGQKPRPDQLKFIKAMRNSGAIAGWADSVERAVQVVFEKGE